MTWQANYFQGWWFSPLAIWRHLPLSLCHWGSHGDLEESHSTAKKTSHMKVSSLALSSTPLVNLRSFLPCSLTAEQIASTLRACIHVLSQLPSLESSQKESGENDKTGKQFSRLVIFSPGYLKASSSELLSLAWATGTLKSQIAQLKRPALWRSALLPCHLHWWSTYFLFCLVLWLLSRLLQQQ